MTPNNLRTDSAKMSVEDDFATDVSLPIKFQETTDSNYSNRRLQVECSSQSDGSLTCIQRAFPANFTDTVFFGCLASASTLAECQSCTIVLQDDETPGDFDLSNGDPQCNSCTVCSDTVLAFDCSNLGQGPCVSRDCDNVCSGNVQAMPSSDSPSTAVIAGSLAGAAGFLILCLVVFLLCRLRRNKPTKERSVPPVDVAQAARIDSPFRPSESFDEESMYTGSPKSAKHSPPNNNARNVQSAGDDTQERFHSSANIPVTIDENGRYNRSEANVQSYSLEHENDNDSANPTTVSSLTYDRSSHWVWNAASTDDDDNDDTKSEFTVDSYWIEENSPFSEFEVKVPAGKLGLVLATPDGASPQVKHVHKFSPLVHKVQVGDLLVAVDGRDVSMAPSTTVSLLLASKSSSHDRRLTFVRPKQMNK